MSLRVQLALQGNLESFGKEVSARVAAIERFAVTAYGARLKLALRDDVRSGGLGDKVANAWQQRDYDNSGSPATLVYSKAPEIVTAFANDTTIAPRDGHLWLALPTDNVPRLGGHRMTPQEVEIRYDQKLAFVDTRPGTALAFVDVAPRRRRTRRTKGDKTPAGRGGKPQLVLMFVMVQQVHLRKRLDWPRIMTDAKDGFEDFLAGQVEAALKD